MAEQSDRPVVRELVEQLEWHWANQARPRLEGLTDEEYFWEPVPGTWNIRHRDQDAPASVTTRLGAGEYLFEFARPEPDPVPVTSIAWRLSHVVFSCFGLRAKNHFDTWPYEMDTFEIAGDAAGGLAQLDEAYEAWMSGVRGLTEEALWAPVGPAEGPWHESPMVTLVLHLNREGIHHLAEVALLRDLYAHRS